jgi:hypothetical protein
MAVTPTVIIDPIVAANAQTTQYTSTGATTIIDKYTVRNYGGAATTIAVNLVKVGTAASSTNLIVSRTIQIGETYTCPELVGHVLEPGDFISTLAGAAASIAMRASGRVIT